MTGSFGWRAPLAGLASLVIAIGFGRYAYTALMPALVLEGQLTPNQAGYTAAVNLIGYVVGALLGPRMGRRVRTTSLARLGIAMTVIGLAASAMPLGFWWLSGWRFVVGLGAGVVMACGTSLILTTTPPMHLARASGIVFAGVGLGTALSGVAVPNLLPYGTSVTWLGLAAMGLILLPVAWNGWPVAAPGGDGRRAGHEPPRRTALSPAALAHVAAYFLYGVGLMPHTIFWVDYVARGLGAGVERGGVLWALVGVGAIAGPPIAGAVAGRFGFKAGLLVAFPVFSLGIALPMISAHFAALVTSSLIFGVMLPAIPALISGRSWQLLSDEEFPVFWGTMTAAVSLGQGLGGYAMAAVFDLSQSFEAVFLGGSLLVVIGTALCLVRPRRLGAPAPGRRPD